MIVWEKEIVVLSPRGYENGYPLISCHGGDPLGRHPNPRKDRLNKS
jgi:hypothetical protein